MGLFKSTIKNPEVLKHSVRTIAKITHKKTAQIILLRNFIECISCPYKPRSWSH